MIDFTRRRFLFGLAAAPLVVPAVKHFVMPRWEPERAAPLFKLQWSRDAKTWHDGSGLDQGLGILTRATLTRPVYEADGFGGFILRVPA